MCGIVGIVDPDPSRRPEPGLLARMTSVITHRGPDDEGFHIVPPVGLGHRRLSIIDLGGGAQPMDNEDGTIWIVFNGEIFNFPELRRELESAGHVFKTRSDTECILHLYEEMGPRCPERLVGQFAFALWDAPRRRLVLARDQVGIKPCYYHERNGRLIFASELKAILEDGSVPRELDRESVFDFLTYRYVPGPRSIYRGIQKLPPGHILVWENGRIDIQRYWSMPSGPDRIVRGETEEKCARRLEALLRESVRGQLMSDVPLGAFLSGGIDSSIVVGLMAGLLEQPVKTFTIGFPEEDFSELPFARQVAALHETEHHELVVEPESVEILPRLVHQLDEPFADPSAIPTYYVCKMAREHVTVCLSGDGGDEGFAGYRRYQWALKYARRDIPPVRLAAPLLRGLAALLPRGRYRTAAARLAQDPASRYADLFGCLGREAVQAVLTEDFRSSIERRREFEVFRDLFDRAAGADYLTRLQLVDVGSYLPDDILVKADRMSMLSSLEVRVPLLDHRVLEMASTIPVEWRLGKRILKKAAGHLLPPQLLQRGKMGFGVPLKHWFRGDWRQYAEDLLLGKRARERGILDPRGVRAVIDAQLSAQSGATLTLYSLVVLEEWCRQYLDGDSRSTAALERASGEAPRTREKA